MPPQSGLPTVETLPSRRRVHVVGAGPVGLLLTALLQPLEGFSVRLYEKRREYTRTRMVQLASYLVADSVESYCTDYIDGENVEAVFDPSELDEGLAFRQSIPSDLMALLREWAQGFCPLNAIEHSLSDLIDARGSNPVQRTAAVVTARGRDGDARAGRHPDRLHGQQVTASRSPGARLRCGGGREHAQHPARIRARHHLSVRPAVRLQRVLQVLQERREPVTTSSFRRSIARTTTAASAT